MMRVTWRTSVFVALYLLTSTATTRASDPERSSVPRINKPRCNYPPTESSNSQIR